MKDFFIIKTSLLNSVVFCFITAGVTYIDARLTSHVAYGARNYYFGYWICLLGPVIFFSTLIFGKLIKSWKVKVVGFPLILIIVSLFSQINFRPEIPHGMISLTMLVISFICLVTSFIHYTPFNESFIYKQGIDYQLKIERIKELVTLWRTIAISIIVSYLALLIPWGNLIWSQNDHIVLEMSEKFLLSQFGISAIIIISFYILFGLIYESFLKASLAADLILKIKKKGKSNLKNVIK
jgi:hypothetical protein